MIIAIDNVSTGLATSPATLGGMRMYLQNFVNSLVRHGPQHEYILFSPDWFVSPFERDTANLRDVRVGDIAASRIRRVAFEQLGYRKVIYRHRPDVFIGLQNTLPFRLAVPSLFFVKSIQYLFFPEAYSRARLFYLRWVIRTSMSTATKALVPAKAVGDDLVRVLGVPPAKIEVLPEALYIIRPDVLAGPNGEALRARIEALAHGRPFVLSVGATYGYKNLQRLVKAFARFKALSRSPAVLLLIGGEAGTSFIEIKALARSVGRGDEVVCCGPLPHQEVVAAYNLADMMVMPSLYETFGHPVLEAMACGCPVVTSNVSAMPEVAGDAAALVDPYDVEDIAESMLRIARDESYRALLIKRGHRRAGMFTWEQTASKALRIIEQVAYSGVDR